MNKRIKIMGLSVLSLSLLSGRQVEAWPSFKKSAGSTVLAAGVTYALWKNRDSVRDSIQEWKTDVLAAGFTYALRKKRDSIRDSIQERKNKAQEWFKDRFGECKEKMSNAKESIVQTLSEKKYALQTQDKRPGISQRISLDSLG